MMKKIASLVIVIAAMTVPAGAAGHDQTGGCSQRVLTGIKHAAGPSVYALAKAGCAAASQHLSDASLGLFEEAMRVALPDARTFGMLQSIYWPEIERNHEGLRAAGFFRSLVRAHSGDPEVLAAAGNALGMALPELKTAGAPQAVASRWAAEAQADYAKALTVDPDNFSAQLGRAIFLSHIPGRFEESRRQFEKLLTLRRRYPHRHYPWSLVFLQWARAARRNGHPHMAQKILDRGRAMLPGDPVLANAHVD